MLDRAPLKAILFDSGRVLNYPRTGNWYLPPNFFRYVDRELFQSLDQNRLEEAFRIGHQYNVRHHLARTESEEWEHFIAFYQLVLNELLKLGVNDAAIRQIATDAVFNDEKFVFYEDVFTVIPELSRRYRLGVVSDTWPSLARVYQNAGLRHYFAAFIMSSVIGVRKPHELMFNAALAELGLRPEEAVFNDDWAPNLDGARKLGLQTILMARDECGARGDAENHPMIPDLTGLQNWLGIPDPFNQETEGANQ